MEQQGMTEQQEHEPRKLFVGGLPLWGVTPAKLRAHFARYGHVVEALVMVLPDGVGRGFGFVEFQDEEAVLRALDVREREAHDEFFGREVEVKRAERKQGTRSTPTQSTRYNRNADSKKIFVGGLGDKITKDDLTDYFEKFGTITDAVVFYDKFTQKARGFGFVTFDSQEATDKVLEKSFHYLKGTKVETKNAEPRDQNGRYHGSMARGAMGPANSYGGMYTPHNMPFISYHPYLVPYPCPYAPPGYMMNQTGTSNDTWMMTMQVPPMMYPHYGRSYGYDAASLKLESDRKVKGNQQRLRIPASTEMKSDPGMKPLESDSEVKGNQQRLHIPASTDMRSDPAKPDSNLL